MWQIFKSIDEILRKKIPSKAVSLNEHHPVQSQIKYTMTVKMIVSKYTEDSAVHHCPN